MSTITTRPVQIIEGQNLDPRKLIGLLSDVYGQDKFKVEDEGRPCFTDEDAKKQLRLNRYKIYHSEDAANELLTAV
ncbi:hypothetical protein SLS58_005542 [Diplodia intermedia]|uniref:Uncharacterized protein n=1 Tax=Diplodia intermedia TaxID=856260 RepID=A0ABR3TQG7_9PEZI